MAGIKTFTTEDVVSGEVEPNRATRRAMHKAAGLPMSRPEDKFKETMAIPKSRKRKRG